MRPCAQMSLCQKQEQKTKCPLLVHDSPTIYGFCRMSSFRAIRQTLTDAKWHICVIGYACTRSNTAFSLTFVSRWSGWFPLERLLEDRVTIDEFTFLKRCHSNLSKRNLDWKAWKAAPAKVLFLKICCNPTLGRSHFEFLGKDDPCMGTLGRKRRLQTVCHGMSDCREKQPISVVLKLIQGIQEYNLPSTILRPLMSPMVQLWPNY